jgi:uncharacterized protein YfaS (alpha-2-macroglobulin family)
MADRGAIALCSRMFVARVATGAERRGLSGSAVENVGATGSIRGTVSASTGAPVANCRVMLIDSINNGVIGAVLTDSSGAYAFTNLDTTRTYSVAAADPSGVYNMARADRVTPV